MLQSADYAVLKQKGISESLLMEQLQAFKVGFPMLKIIGPAKPDHGVLQFNADEVAALLKHWYTYLEKQKTILKFVPASGAASRMFKELFEFLDGSDQLPSNALVVEFFNKINDFAFYELLNDTCIRYAGKDIHLLIKEQQHKKIVDLLLNEKGLNYGILPKGLLLFHSYDHGKRTPVEEHLSEGALYAMNKHQEVNIHFTVSGEHRALFEKHVEQIQQSNVTGSQVTFQLTFSEQKPATDTIAVDEHNEFFREHGALVFRPGGHGALIENLNDLAADIVFIKNIDNVVPDALKNTTIIYKKVIAGYLVKLQQQIFDLLKEMDANPRLDDERLAEIANFCEFELNNVHPNIASLQGIALQTYLYNKLNRPIRVCGMVKNTGEPGGGPFLTENQDKTISPQILESSQIDLNNPIEKDKLMQSTHFNPVDLVCGVKNYKGEKFDLLKFVDKNTGFISLKSKNGKVLKALELPGLWNGAMSDWNTIFVEVPIATFNPVKTVNDLLRVEHQ